MQILNSGVCSLPTPVCMSVTDNRQAAPLSSRKRRVVIQML